MAAAVQPGAALDSLCPEAVSTRHAGFHGILCALWQKQRTQHSRPTADLKSNNKKLSKKDLFRDKESSTTYGCAMNPLVLSERLLGSRYMLLKYFSLWAKQAWHPCWHLCWEQTLAYSENIKRDFLLAVAAAKLNTGGRGRRGHRGSSS